MKIKLPTGISVLIALVLVAFGLLYGTWSGYSEERAGVMALLETPNGLMDVLDYRAADGFNLYAVAKRHLSETHEALAALNAAARSLRESTDLAARCEADQALASAVSAVASALEADSGFQQSARDQNYLAMLLADLNNLSASGTTAAYNTAAAEFNHELNAPLFGALAELLGVKPCPLYQ